MSEPYTYAVARIRAKELSLFGRQELDQLLSCKSYADCLRLLADKGWGGSAGETDAEAILSAELDKTWKLMRELVEDPTIFDVFLYPIDYNNLKAAVKAVVTDADQERIFIRRGTVEPEVMVKAIKERDFSLLPEQMRQVAEQAFQTLLRTGDGQLCDVMLDKAALEAILQAGKNADDALIGHYAERTVAVTDIKIAVRGCKTGKDKAFFQRAMATCETLDIASLAQAAVKNEEEIYAYLSHTAYSGAVEELKASPSAFERWCDDQIMALIRTQKTNPFTVGPLAAYLLARENEIKAVRLILSGKRNQLNDQVIRERLREMYV